MNSTRTTYSIALLVSALLAGCASPPQRHAIQAPLDAPVLYTDPRYETFYMITRVEARAAPGQDLTVGRLWITHGMDGAVNFIRLADVSSFEAQSSADGGRTFITTRSGAKLQSNTRMVLLCPLDVTPTKKDSCPQAWNFFGASINRSTPIPKDGTEQRDVFEFYSYIAKSVWVPKILSLDEVKERFAKETEQAKIAAENAAVRQKAEAERFAQLSAQRAAEKEARSRERIVALRGHAAGTKVYCMSTGLIARDAPLFPDLEFNCPPIGKNTLGELEKAGWNTSMLGRKPGQSFDVVGEYVEISAVKSR